MKAQHRLKNLRRQHDRLLQACELYKRAAERRVARGQIRQEAIQYIDSIRADLEKVLPEIHALPKLPPEQPLERALYGPLVKIRAILEPLYERIEALPEFVADETDEQSLPNPADPDTSGSAP